MSSWLLLNFILVIIHCLASAVCDLRCRRIPNWIIASGLFFALMWHGAAPVGVWALHPKSAGGVGVFAALITALVVLVALFPLWLLRIFGAGDVKLLAVVAAFFGARADAWLHVVELLLCVFVVGGLVAFLRLLFLRRVRRASLNIKIIVSQLRFRVGGGGESPKFNSVYQTVDRFPFGVAIFLGVLVYGLRSVKNLTF